MKRAVAYTRVSTKHQVIMGVSLSVQREKIKEWSKLHNYDLIKVFCDAGISGYKKRSRPEFDRAVETACRLKAALVVYKLDRFARSTVDIILTSERLNKAGADLVSLSEKIDTTTAMGKRKEEPEWYRQLVTDLKQLAFEGIVKTKWLIGKRILEDGLKFEKPKYGDKKMEGLAKDLDTNPSNLWRCVRFAKKFPKYESVTHNLSWREIVKLLPEPKIKKPKTPLLPKGKYNVIYADPPWEYRDKLIEGYGAAEHHYPTMSIEKLCGLLVHKLAAEIP